MKKSSEYKENDRIQSTGPRNLNYTLKMKIKNKPQHRHTGTAQKHQGIGRTLSRATRSCPLKKQKRKFLHRTRNLQALPFACLFAGRSFSFHMCTVQPSGAEKSSWLFAASGSPTCCSSRGKFAAVCSLLQQLSNSLCMTSA